MATTASADGRDPPDESDPWPVRDRQRGLPLRALGVVFEPIRWKARFGWRPLMETEKLAPFYFWREVGRRMAIKDLPDADYAFDGSTRLRTRALRAHGRRPHHRGRDSRPPPRPRDRARPARRPTPRGARPATAGALVQAPRRGRAARTGSRRAPASGAPPATASDARAPSLLPGPGTSSRPSGLPEVVKQVYLYGAQV